MQTLTQQEGTKEPGRQPDEIFFKRKKLTDKSQELLNIGSASAAH